MKLLIILTLFFVFFLKKQKTHTFLIINYIQIRYIYINYIMY